MPTPTYTPLANLTLSSTAASVTFSSISQSYRDLVLVAVTTGSQTTSISMNLNGDTTTTNYNRVYMGGSGTSATSSTATNQYIASSFTSTSQHLLNIMDYSATDKHKTVLSRLDNAADSTRATATRWANTAAITSVQILVNAGTFAAGSTFALYGIAS